MNGKIWREPEAHCLQGEFFEVLQGKVFVIGDEEIDHAVPQGIVEHLLHVSRLYHVPDDCDHMPNVLFFHFVLSEEMFFKEVKQRSCSVVPEFDQSVFVQYVNTHGIAF